MIKEDSRSLAKADTISLGEIDGFLIQTNLDNESWQVHMTVPHETTPHHRDTPLHKLTSSLHEEKEFIYVVMSGVSTLVVAQFLANQRDNLGVKCIYLMRARVITFTIIVVVVPFLIATPTPTNSYGSI